MSERLEDRLVAAKGGPVELDGRLVSWWYELPRVGVPSELQVRLEAQSSRPQGLCLRAGFGDLSINGQVYRDIDVTLWSDTAPPDIAVGLVPRDAEIPMTLRVWNVWRVPTGMTPQTVFRWMGDAGMVVEPDAECRAFILRCSDGFPPPAFGDLVATLALQSRPR